MRLDSVRYESKEGDLWFPILVAKLACLFVKELLSFNRCQCQYIYVLKLGLFLCVGLCYCTSFI